MHAVTGNGRLQCSSSKDNKTKSQPLPNLAIANSTTPGTQMTCSDSAATDDQSHSKNSSSSTATGTIANIDASLLPWRSSSPELQRHKNSYRGNKTTTPTSTASTGNKAMLVGDVSGGSTTSHPHEELAMTALPVTTKEPLCNSSGTTASTCTTTSCSTSTNTNPMQSLMETVVHAVENVQEQHRRAKCRQRISQTLLTLRAANEVHFQQQQQQQLILAESEESKQSSYDEDEQDQHDQHPQDDLEQHLSDLGSALFYPLMDPVVLLHSGPKPKHTHRLGTPGSADSCSSSATTSAPIQPPQHVPSSTSPVPINKDTPTTDTLDHHHEEKKQDDDHPHSAGIPVEILDEPGGSSNPRLLSDTMFQQLVQDGVPECLHMNAWERAYSMGRDGDSFRTLLDKCAPYRHSILVVQTTTGYLLGGFVSDAWQEQDGYQQKHSYYGTGVSFLFCSHPAETTETAAARQERSRQHSSDNNTHNKPLTIFPWTGSNDFCQICDLERNIIAMGGAGAFGFILEDDLFRGTTDTCGTFANPPLTPDRDGIFTVAAMEIYGLVPLFATAATASGSSPRSTVLDSILPHE